MCGQSGNNQGSDIIDWPGCSYLRLLPFCFCFYFLNFLEDYELTLGYILTISFHWYIVVSGGEHVDVIIGAAVADGKVTPKVQSLIKILLKYKNTEDFRAIIFVERVVTALVLPKVQFRYYIKLLTIMLFILWLASNSLWHVLFCKYAGFCRVTIPKFCAVSKFDWAQQ